MGTPKTIGDEEMTNEYRETPEEKSYGRLLNESEEVLSEAGRTVLDRARATAYAQHLVRSYCLQLEEYEVAMTEMRIAATELTDRDSELLARLWRAALGAGAAVDPYDVTPPWPRVTCADVHHYYRMVSGMVERTLLEKTVEERRRAAEHEPEDFYDVPF